MPSITQVDLLNAALDEAKGKISGTSFAVLVKATRSVTQGSGLGGAEIQKAIAAALVPFGNQLAQINADLEKLDAKPMQGARSK